MSEKTEPGVAATAREADAKPLPSKITQAGDQARQAGAQAAAHAYELADDASERGASLAGDVKDHLASAAERRKGGLADQLDDVAKAVQEVKAGKVEFRTDKTALVHVPVGKISFTP